MYLSMYSAMLFIRKNEFSLVTNDHSSDMFCIFRLIYIHVNSVIWSVSGDSMFEKK